ncbi:hypothetical protein BT93_L2320 [Corymbia citriodora subsp. variegata]|uniref:Uncharacterized protein n=1 Tax=Corymbia citriodora subsp. variegata TaxID=360336 RepID=A0A8T0CLG4_CORYI|nr:hypothetical protein BT93_L2320 [Corymbia citriodora subsp. variegata]
MAGAPANLYRAMRSYWRRRGYKRLAGPGSRRQDREDRGSAPGGARRRRRRSSWRVKVAPRVKLLRLAASPRRFFIWLRDAYVKMMLGFASSGMLGSGFGYGYGAGFSIGDARAAGFGRAPAKEYDQKMLVEIYKSMLAAQGQLAPPGEAGRLSAPRSLADG